MTGACTSPTEKRGVSGTDKEGKHAPVSLNDQIEEVGKQLRDFERRAPWLIDNGKIYPDTAQRKIDHLRAAYRTLEWMALNEAWIKQEAKLRRAAELHEIEQRELLEEIENDPALQSAREAFPDAEIAQIRNLETEGEKA